MKRSEVSTMQINGEFLSNLCEQTSRKWWISCNAYSCDDSNTLCPCFWWLWNSSGSLADPSIFFFADFGASLGDYGELRNRSTTVQDFELVGKSVGLLWTPISVTTIGLRVSLIRSTSWMLSGVFESDDWDFQTLAEDEMFCSLSDSTAPNRPLWS